MDSRAGYTGGCEAAGGGGGATGHPLKSLWYLIVYSSLIKYNFEYSPT